MAGGIKKLKDLDLLSKESYVKSCVFCSDPRICFQDLAWLTISDFVNIDKSKKLTRNFPSGLDADGEATFIGKTRSILSQSNCVTDKLGTVKRSTRKMEIIHQGKLFEIQQFLVMGLRDLNNCEWKPIKDLPKYALRVGIDVVSQNVLYIGRSTIKDLTYLGYISGPGSFQAPVSNKQNLLFNNVEVLCLKPSPAGLKHLCRARIRDLTHNENTQIDKLDEVLNDSDLVSFLRFKSYLKSNECLKPGESIVSRNGLYKLSLLDDGRLLYYFNEERDFLFLYENVESLWLNDLKLVVCFKDFTSKIFLTGEENFNMIIDDAKFKIDDNGTLKLMSPHHEKLIVFQFRDDIESNWNLKKPVFDFVYFFEEKKARTESDSDSETDSSSGDSDSDSCESESNG